jgi:GTPase SAR1 family protein
MNAIVILCGGDSSGKTTTIKRFFKDESTIMSSGRHFFERILDDNRVYAISSCSPHEIVNCFCDVDGVNKDIEKRTDECDKKANGQRYILIIPFTMSFSRADRNKLNEDCILKPIEDLKKAYKVFIIYLKKSNAKLCSQMDALMKRVESDKTIETTKKVFNKSTELEAFIKEKAIKTLHS